MNSIDGPFLKSSTLTYRTKGDSFERGCLLFLWRMQGARTGHPRGLSYKSGLCGKSFAEGRFDVQVSKNSADIPPLPKDLSRKPWPEAHLRVQARLVHRIIDTPAP